MSHCCTEERLNIISISVSATTGAAAAELERDEEIFVKLKEVFPTVDVVLDRKEITFLGDTRKKADSMMFLFRYLSNEKKIICIR